MAEFLGFLWLGSFLLSLPFTAWNIISVMKAAKTPEMKTLNFNLKKVGLFWSLSTESFQSRTEESNPKVDHDKSVRGMALLGGLGLLSLLGLTFLIIVSLSLRLIIKNKKTGQVVKTELARNSDLSEEQVRALVKELDMKMATL